MTPIGPDFPEILAAAQEGAEWAWTRIYHSVAVQLAGYARAKGAPEPEEVVGEVFHDVARNIGKFTGTESQFRSWVFGIAHNRLIDQWRKQSRSPAGLLAQQEQEQSAEIAALGSMLEGPAFAALESLTDRQRAVLMLRSVADLSLEEVADVLDLNVNAVKALQHRAVARLRKSLERPVTK